MKRSKDAFEAFHRGLGRSAEDDRKQIISKELERLSSLEARIRTRDADEPETLAHRLNGLEQMRLRLQRSDGTA